MKTLAGKRVYSLIALALVGLTWLILGQPLARPAEAHPTEYSNATSPRLTCGEVSPGGEPPRRYRPCEVVLSGRRIQDINALVDAVRDDSHNTLTLQPRQPPTIKIGGKYVRRYYIQTSDTIPAPLIVRRIRRIAERLAPGGATDPNRVGADPNRVLGTPWVISGSPWHAPGGPAPALARDQFEGQWALTVAHGIGLTGRDGQRRVSYQGRGISVGVFDTAPISGNITTTISITRTGATFTVVDPLQVDPLPPPTASNTMGSHGLFVLGLVYALAPESRITLIRILDNQGQGTVMGLYEALQRYTEAETARPDFAGGVINLSLGVDLDSAATGEDDTDIQTLKEVLDETRALGFVIVAAAGNQSTAATPQPPQLPASHPGVIGVTSVNYDAQRSCFANSSLGVAAPGGEGNCSTPTPPPASGVSAGLTPSPLRGIEGLDARGPAAPTPSPGGGCEQWDADHRCLISFMRLEDDYAHYGYWSGTSFSTPLVSGLAALVLEQTQPAPVVHMTSAERVALINEVEARIYAGAMPGEAALGHGRVDVVRTLYPHQLFLPGVYTAASLPGSAP